MAGLETKDPTVAEGGRDLQRVLGPWQLIAVGIGAIIGAGIFVITGQAAAQYAGPAIILSFVIAGVGCVFAGLCYAELAAMIPVSGSAYTYSYAAFGRLAAWIIGWDLVLEYGLAASAVSVGWSGYLLALIKDLGVVPLEDLEAWRRLWAQAPVAYKDGALITTGAFINLPAMAIIAFLTALLTVGIRASATVNGLMVLLKVGIVILVIVFGLPLINPANLTPFVPESTGELGEFGPWGVLRAAGVIFFAYIGFDAVSVAAQEARNPQRDMPIAILGSLAICTVLYILMSLTMVGLTPYTTLNVENPVSVAVGAAGDQLKWLLPLVNLGAIAGLSTVILISLYGQSRIFYSMSRDGMLPWFDKVNPRFGTPVRGTVLIGVFAAVLGGVFPLDILGELVSIGTLLAFVLVCIGVMVLRATKPHVKRPFRTPFSPIVPILGVLVCGAMMSLLPLDTWIRLAFWFAAGMLIYSLYGVRYLLESGFAFDESGRRSVKRLTPLSVHLFSPQGRFSRTDIWVFTLGYLGATFIAALLDIALVTVFHVPVPVFGPLIVLLYLWPNFASAIKRFHDRGMSGWWAVGQVLIVGFPVVVAIAVFPQSTGGPSDFLLLPLLVASVASIAFFVVLYCLPGEKGSNKYGADPREGRQQTLV